MSSRRRVLTEKKTTVFVKTRHGRALNNNVIKSLGREKNNQLTRDGIVAHCALCNILYIIM